MESENKSVDVGWLNISFRGKLKKILVKRQLLTLAMQTVVRAGFGEEKNG